MSRNMIAVTLAALVSSGIAVRARDDERDDLEIIPPPKPPKLEPKVFPNTMTRQQRRAAERAARKRLPSEPHRGNRP